MTLSNSELFCCHKHQGGEFTERLIDALLKQLIDLGFTKATRENVAQIANATFPESTAITLVTAKSFDRGLVLCLRCPFPYCCTLGACYPTPHSFGPPCHFYDSINDYCKLKDRVPVFKCEHLTALNTCDDYAKRPAACALYPTARTLDVRKFEVFPYCLMGFNALIEAAKLVVPK